MTEKSLTVGVDHVGLTVRELQTTLAFFTDCLGWKQIGEKPEYPAAFVSDGHMMLTLWQVRDANNSIDFDRKKNIGLHHLALRVNSYAGLQEIYDRVNKWPGVEIEFAPELLGSGPKQHMMIYEPGGVRIEFNFDPRLHSN